MKQQTEKQLENVIGLKRNEIAANVRGELMPQNIAMKIRGFFTGENEETENAAEESDCDNCPYKPYCIARLNDRTITGCNLPLYWSGLISKGDVVIEHTVKEVTE